ncbi:MAG: condensation domain-containing protein, partial [candidate division WOR-3 bacterium]
MSKRLADLTVEEKRDLLAKALRKKAQEAARVPLSYQQQGLWFLDQLESGNPLSNLVWAMRISGRIDMDGVQQALNEIVRRHEPLRTIFRFEGGEPVQVVSLPLPLPVKIIDLSELAPDEQEKEIQRLVREEARTPFDLATGPLLRVTLLRCGPEEHVASVTIHHIIADGWSTGVFARELWALYNAFSKGQPSPLPEPPIQYRDYVRWQRERLQGDRLDRLLTYWKSHLQNAPHLLHVRTDRPRPPVMTYNGATVSFLLPKALSESLKELSRKEGVTLFRLLLAAFSVLLHRHVDQDEMLIGTPISGRERPETQGLIGFFVNTL